jgi:Ca2+-binding RTX toxin-like protein
VLSIEAFLFSGTGISDPIQANFTTSQLGGGLATTLAVTGSLGTDIITITGTGSVDVSGWSLTNWSPGDFVAITVGGGPNVLIGTSGDHRLDGGVGADTLVGGTGNDTFVTDGLDIISETLLGGIDTVEAALSYTLGANLENLTLLGVGNFAGRGNSVENTLVGNSGANLLDGRGGLDSLVGGDGFDTLIGGAGADFMQGDLGNDKYVVDDALDVVFEFFGEGIDTVRSSVTFTLPFEVEYLNLTGAAAIDGTGNDSVNVMVGNNAANTLLGLAG